jgi:hypothetical protein
MRLSIKAADTIRARLQRVTPSRGRRCDELALPIEVIAGQTTPAELKQLIEKLVDRPAVQ